MIMASFKPLEVGKIYRNWTIADKGQNHPGCTFKVMREATKQEWIEYHGEIPGNDFFYEISID